MTTAAVRLEKNCHIFRKRTACVPLSCNMNRSILHIASCNMDHYPLPLL